MKMPHHRLTNAGNLFIEIKIKWSDERGAASASSDPFKMYRSLIPSVLCLRLRNVVGESAQSSASPSPRSCRTAPFQRVQVEIPSLTIFLLLSVYFADDDRKCNQQIYFNLSQSKHIISMFRNLND